MKQNTGVGGQGSHPAPCFQVFLKERNWHILRVSRKATSQRSEGFKFVATVFRKSQNIASSLPTSGVLGFLGAELVSEGWRSLPASSPYAPETEACVFSTFVHHPSPSVLYTKLVCLFQNWSLLSADLTVLDLMFLLPEVFPAIQLIPTIPPQTEQSRNKVLQNDVRFVVTCNVND